MQVSSIILANGLFVLVREFFWALLMIVAGGLFLASVILVFDRRRRKNAIWLSATSIFFSAFSFWPLYKIRVDYPALFPEKCVVISILLLVVALALFIISVAFVLSRKMSLRSRIRNVG